MGVSITLILGRRTQSVPMPGQAASTRLVRHCTKNHVLPASTDNLIISPGLMLKLSFFTATKSPYCLCNPLVSMRNDLVRSSTQPSYLGPIVFGQRVALNRAVFALGVLFMKGQAVLGIADGPPDSPGIVGYAPQAEALFGLDPLVLRRRDDRPHFIGQLVADDLPFPVAAFQ